MVKKIDLKMVLAVAGLLLQFNVQAQEVEDITGKFSWQIDPELTVYSNSMTRLEVANLNAKSEDNKKRRQIDYRAIVMSMNWKENMPFVITWDLQNKNIDPYSYRYTVYETTKKGKPKKTQHKGNIYWGINVELFSLDGSIVSHGSWLCVGAGTYGNAFSLNKNNNGWADITNSINRGNANIRSMVIQNDEYNNLSINGTSYAHIAGIKSITIMAGSAASIALNNFTVARLKSNGRSGAPRQSGNRANDDWKGNGTGFFIDRMGYIATNHHVIDNANDIEIEFHRNGERQVHQVEVVQSDKQNDLAILKITDGSFRPFFNIPYNFRTNVMDVGTNVFALGYPMALSVMGTEIKFTDGRISSKTGVQGDATVYQISVPIQPGNSGGPLFDYGGNLIGITSATLKRDVFQTENVNYAVKSTYLKNLIDVLPISLKLPNDNSIADQPLTEQIKILQGYVVLVKIK
jgi:S1-C subfamily serine protease